MYADDVVWRVKADERWVYLYLLIEFQSRIDRFMALRMLVYVGLLYQDLVRSKQLGPDGLLPPVLPWSGASEKLIVDDKDAWITPSEKTGLTATPDYAETLAQWRDRFLHEHDRVLALGFDQRFMRIWEFYLAYCEAGFRGGNIDVVQYTLRKPA